MVSGKMVSGTRRAGHTARFGFAEIYHSVYYNSLPFGGGIANFGIRSFTQIRLGKENGASGIGAMGPC